eukprot:scaffold310170_cov75-Attheya_sp.AAC.2
MPPGPHSWPALICLILFTPAPAQPVPQIPISPPTLVSAQQFQHMPPHCDGVSGYTHHRPFSPPYQFASARPAFTTPTFPYFSVPSCTWPFFAILLAFASFILKERGFLHLLTYSTLCQGSGLSPGNHHLNESQRSESTAYLSALRFLLHYHRYYQVTLESSSKLHFCDNKILVSRSPDTYQSALPSSFDFLKADYDVQMQIMDTIREMDTVIPTSHVHGHQDSKKYLSYEARLNIQADLLVTRACQRHYTGHKHVHYSASQCSFYIKNQVITRAYRKTMRQAYASHYTSTYLHEKYNWDNKQCESVDWYIHGSSIECRPHNILRFTHRFIIDWLPRNQILSDRNCSPTNKCQTCNVEIETERHFIWCEKNSQHGGNYMSCYAMP